MATATGTAKMYKLTVNKNNVIVVTGKKSTPTKIY